jgi:hypothetical protein
MPDNILFLVFGSISALSIILGSVCLYIAYRYSIKFTHETKMVLWATAGIAGIVFGTLCWAYFLIPIILNHL